MIEVFVPKTGSFVASTVAPGSAIIGKLLDDSPEGEREIYFEGNIYDIESLTRYADRCLQATNRMFKRYPTVARMRCKKDDLVKIGIFDEIAGQVILDEGETPRKLLVNWLGGKMDDNQLLSILVYRRTTQGY